MGKINDAMPSIYFEEPLVVYFDEALETTIAEIAEFGNVLASLDTEDAATLDYLALLYGLENLYWNRNWSPSQKRAMLNFDVIRDRGSAASLSYVLTNAGYPNIVELAGDFLVGINEVGDPIGIAPWTYTLTLPTRFERRMFEIDLICYYWQPAWLRRLVVYDDAPFTFEFAHSVGGDDLHSPADDEVISLGDDVL